MRTRVQGMSSAICANILRSLYVPFILLFLSQFIFNSDAATKIQKSESVPGIRSYLAGGQYVMLTFDNGPHALLTMRILDILKSRNASATFFVQGMRALEHPNIIKR